MADKHLETQEQSIKARKNQIYEADAPAAVDRSDRPFKAFLRDTPAAPLSGAAKGVLWATGVLVVLVLAAALAKTLHHHSKAAPKPARKTARAVVPADGPDRSTRIGWDRRGMNPPDHRLRRLTSLMG